MNEISVFIDESQHDPIAGNGMLSAACVFVPDKDIPHIQGIVNAWKGEQTDIHMYKLREHERRKMIQNYHSLNLQTLFFSSSPIKGSRQKLIEEIAKYLVRIPCSEKIITKIVLDHHTSCKNDLKTIRKVLAGSSSPNSFFRYTHSKSRDETLLCLPDIAAYGYTKGKIICEGKKFIEFYVK